MHPNKHAQYTDSFYFLLSRELVMTANILYRTHHNKHAQYRDTNRDLTVNVIVTS